MAKEVQTKKTSGCIIALRIFIKEKIIKADRPILSSRKREKFASLFYLQLLFFGETPFIIDVRNSDSLRFVGELL